MAKIETIYMLHVSCPKDRTTFVALPKVGK